MIGARMRQRGQQAAQHRKAEKSRPAPGNRPQKAADLRSERGIVAQRQQQAIQARQRGDERHRQQHGERQPRAADPARCGAIAGAERMRSERRHGGKDPLEHDAAGEIEHRAEPRGGERHGAEPPDHHHVGDAHRHLREIGRRERRRERKGRPQFRPDAIDRFHLALSHLRHGAAADARERPSKRKGPDRYRRGPVLSRVGRVQRTRIPSGPAAKPREFGGRHQAWKCANHG